MMFSALVRASLDGAMLVALVWAATRMLPRLTPVARTTLWWLAAAKFVVGLLWLPPVIVPILPAEHVSTTVANTAAHEAPEQRDPVAATRTTGVPLSVAVTPESPGSLLDWPLIMVGGWTFGVLLTAWVGLRRWLHTRRVLARAAVAPRDIETLAVEVAGCLGLRRVPSVRVSDDVQTPLVAGLIRPVVLLPGGRFANMSSALQRMALCHEMAHVKRGDLWLGCVPALAERLFFFHPLVRLAAREYVFWRESACDAAVLRTLGASPQDYGRLLLDLGIVRPQASLAAAGAPWSFLNLKRRITMLHTPASVSIRSRLIAITVVSVAAAGMIPLELGARRAPLALDAGNARQPTAGSPVSSSLISSHPSGEDPASQGLASGARDGREKEPPLNYVIVLDDRRTTTSGSEKDVERARQLRKPGEQLIWFRAGGREYVVRDSAVLREVEALWKPVNEIGDRQVAHFERQGELELGKKQEEIAAEHDRVAAEQDRLGEQQDRLQDLLAEEQNRMQDKLAEHQAQLEMHERALADRDFQQRAEADWKARETDRHAVEHEMQRAFDEQMAMLDGKTRELDKPMQNLDEKMALIDREMSALHEKMEAAAREVESKMRLLFERAVSSGLAEIVK